MTFTFTMDAFPDYTRFDRTRKVLAAVQIISDDLNEVELRREATKTGRVADDNGIIVEDSNTASIATYNGDV